MLKLVVAAESRREERALIATARAVVPSGEPFTVCALLPHGARTLAEHLDAVLFDRPLADILVVVGRRCAGQPEELRALIDLLRSERDLAAVTTRAALGLTAAHIASEGGAFRCGPLCQAGGFVGDRRTSLGDRLDRVGFRSLVLPESLAGPAVTDRRWPVPA